MAYLPHTQEDRQSMLAAMGLASVEELFSDIPSELRLKRPLALPDGLSELELTQLMQQLAGRNIAASEVISFLGGGSYDHFIPAAVDALASRGEFFTAYTPYQAEASQGTLQVAFEYQSLVTRLTGMDVANASLYDGASAAAEAVFMAQAATGRLNKVAVCESVHPEYRQVISCHLTNLGHELVVVPAPAGRVDPRDVARCVDEQTSCLVLQHPNFFGCLEQVKAIGEAVHAAGAQFIVIVDPISLGLLKRPSDYGADIVVAEGQSLGNAMAYGGPYLGIMACKETLVRRMPGRVAGQTVDRQGRRCFVLTLQTREQHIRRQRATSNICTNQGLLALRASIYLSLLGPAGLREVAELCLRKARYASETLVRAGGFAPRFDGPSFKEFVVRDPRGKVREFLAAAQQDEIFAGVELGTWFPSLSDSLLIAVTEKRTKQEINRLVAIAARHTGKSR